MSHIWNCRKSRLLVLIFWVKNAVGATFFAFCNYGRRVHNFVDPQIRGLSHLSKLCELVSVFSASTVSWNGWKDGLQFETGSASSDFDERIFRSLWQLARPLVTNDFRLELPWAAIAIRCGTHRKCSGLVLYTTLKERRDSRYIFEQRLLCQVRK